MIISHQVKFETSGDDVIAHYLPLVVQYGYCNNNVEINAYIHKKNTAVDTT